ncbi:MAG TPA: MGMT family protein [Bdellovibrionota bacterium]|jgi:methylated-DNA-protein-cysteine methyltransferase-like protein|nr:MGMT family protein [Bdellovibrionota bacterium]
MPSAPISEFSLAIIAAIRKVPRGRVATYGQIAAIAGRPGAARAVVWILHSSSQKHRVPWHRIVNAKGKIAFNIDSTEFQRQGQRLRREGIAVDHMTGKIDLSMFQYRKKSPSPTKSSRKNKTAII